MKSLLGLLILLFLVTGINAQQIKKDKKGDIMSSGETGVLIVGKAVSLLKPKLSRAGTTTVVARIDEKGNVTDVISCVGEFDNCKTSESAARASKFSPSYTERIGDSKIIDSSGKIIALAYGSGVGRFLEVYRTFIYSLSKEDGEDVIHVVEGDVFFPEFKKRLFSKTN